MHRSDLGLVMLPHPMRARGDRHHCRPIITLVSRVSPHYAPGTASPRLLENTGDELIVGWGRQRPDSVALFAHGGRSL